MAETSVKLKLRDGRTYTKKVDARGTWRRSETATRSYYPRQEYIDEVVSYLGTFSEPFTLTEVIDSGDLYVSRTTAYKVLATLENEGVIEKHGNGRHSRYTIRVKDAEGNESDIPMDETTSEGHDDNEEVQTERELHDDGTAEQSSGRTGGR